MRHASAPRTAARWIGAAAALATAAYAGYVAFTWIRYGRTGRSTAPDSSDALLDRFMPVFDVVDRHQIRVDAPAEITFAAATEMDLFDAPIVKAIIKGRELIMRSHSARNVEAGLQPRSLLPQPLARGLLAEAQAIGWGVLAHAPGREIVMGAVTRPWEANVTFRALPPGQFASFSEPDYTKIVWTLRADPIGPSASIFRTETRAVTTDARSRAKFRRYWSFLSPGIRIIRLATLRPLKREAEARARLAWEAAAE